MPTLVSANTNTPVVMIAMRTCRVIRQPGGQAILIEQRRHPLMSKWNKPRRTFVANLLASMVGLTVAGRAQAAVSTPSATEGPYYPTPTMRMPDTDNDLVNISGLVQQAGGEVITLRGSITDPQGNARARHRIEIWQCDLMAIICIRAIDAARISIPHFRIWPRHYR